MRVAIIAFTYLYWGGGAERYADETARNLVALGHEATIYAADFLVNRPAARRTIFPCRVVGVPVIFGPNSRVLGRVWDKNRVEDHFQTLAPAFLIADHLRGKGADLVYGQVSGAIVGLRARKYTHTPVVCMSYNTRWSHFEKYKRWLTLKSDGFMALNQHTMTHHLTVAGADPMPPHMVQRNLIDTQRYTPAKRSSDMRAAYGVGQDDLLLLTLQRMDGRKNMQPVLEAFLEITRRYPHVKALVGGGGPNKETLEAWVQAQPGGERVKFLGIVPDEDLPGLYASADVFVAATHGYVSVEAMSSGVPTLLVNHEPQTPEFVEDGVGGLLVPEDTQALITALESLISDPARRAQISAAGRAFAQRGFDNQRGTQEMVAFFETVLQQAKRH